MALAAPSAPPAESDERLVARVLSGDRVAFDRLYERYLHRVYACVARTGRARWQTERLVEEAMERLLRSLSTRHAEGEASLAALALATTRAVIAEDDPVR